MFHGNSQRYPIQRGITYFRLAASFQTNTRARSSACAEGSELSAVRAGWRAQNPCPRTGSLYLGTVLRAAQSLVRARAPACSGFGSFAGMRVAE
jgi:hypothetical protein